MTEKPRILLFTGDGKGKTTAALGMALRATGHGMKVFVLQFIKQDDTTGEIAAIRSIDNIEIEQTGKGFVPSPGNARFADHREAAEAGLARATDVILSGDYDLVVLDEICITVSRALIAEQDVLDLLARVPDGTRVAMTGRDATEALVGAADTVSDIRCVKHALEAGRPAQKGVEE